MTSQELNPSSHSQKSNKSFRLGRKESQRGSLFSRARASFVRSGGQRGATCENLRGTSGADFESQGDVFRGQSPGGCFCFGVGGGGGSDSEVLILIKGPFCFVFKNETAASPIYAISLAHMKAKHNAPSSTRDHSVVLETTLGDVEYEFVFADAETAEKFETAATGQAAAGEAALVRKRLGHEHLLRKRASVRFAESVAMKKVEDQPEAPVSGEEIMANMPIPGAPM